MVRSRNKSDCGIVAVASVAGVSYAKVKETYGRLDRGGMLPHELEWILSQFCDWRFLKRSRNRLLSAWTAKHATGKYVVVLDCLTHQHAIAVINGQILGEYGESWEISRIYQII